MIVQNQTQKKRRREHWLGACILFLFGALLSGCSSLRLEKPPLTDGASWQQYGGNRERTNIARTAVQPPLEVAWMYDASAGFSEYSVAIADSFVFIGNLRGELYAIHIRTGESAGSYDFGSPIVGAPVIDNEMAYIALANTDESLFGYDLTKGKARWKARIGGIETSPLLMDKKLFVATLGGEVYCLDAATGAIQWKFIAPLFERTAFLHSSPASDGSSIVFGCDDGSLFCISAEDGKLLWRKETGKSLLGSPSLRNGKVFIGSQDEMMYAIELKDGAIAWKTPLGARIYTSQAVSENRVFAVSSAGEVICLESSAGAIKWRFQTESVISVPPLLSGSIVYAGSLDKTLYALDSETGTLISKYTSAARIKGMPVAWGDYIVLLLDNRMVVALKGTGAR